MTAEPVPATATAPGPATTVARDPESRLAALFDSGTMRLLAPRTDCGVLTARGSIDGRATVAYASDATTRGGAIGAEGCERIVDTIDLAVRERTPVVGLWHSDGTRLTEGVVALDAVGGVFAAMVRASGRVPQISVVLGPAAGGAAYGTALTDIVVMSQQGRIFVTGPEVARGVTDEPGDPARRNALDPPAGARQAPRITSTPPRVGRRGRHSDVVHVTTVTDTEAIGTARVLAALLGHQGRLSPADVGVDAAAEDLAKLLPTQPNRAYDVKPLVRALLDHPTDATPGSSTPHSAAPHSTAPHSAAPHYVELHEAWAPNVVTVLGRFAGRTVGVIANNPLRLGGCLDAAGAEKTARFVRMCDALGVPLVVIVDVPGYLPGIDQEWDEVIRRGAKLLHAFAEAVVPRVTLVTRKGYGGAYVAMNSRALGATAVFAWPTAEVGVTGAAAAVDVLHRKKLAASPPRQREALRAELIAAYERGAGGVGHALEVGVIDAVIEPTETRRRIAEALASAPAARGAHTNVPL